MIGKNITAALIRAFTIRGAAMSELFEGERANLLRELRAVRANLAPDDSRARLIDVSLEMGAMPAMRGAMQVFEGTGA